MLLGAASIASVVSSEQFATAAARAACSAAEARTAPLVQVLRQAGSAARIGRAFLGRYPAAADVVWLTDVLSEALRRRGCNLDQASSEALRQALGQQVRDDFAAARVARVDGWVLSVTEARLCALVALAGEDRLDQSTNAPAS